jgi:hypothetical protein
MLSVIGRRHLHQPRVGIAGTLLDDVFSFGDAAKHAICNGKSEAAELALTNRLRTEGMDYLLEAAKAAGARRFVAQSYIGAANIREGGRVKTESHPLDPIRPDG